MYEMIIIGAGPAGISMAAEARGVGIPTEKIVVLEKGDAHSWAIRKFYPAAKPVLANYKGINAVCTGVMCLTDMSKEMIDEFNRQAVESRRERSFPQVREEFDAAHAEMERIINSLPDEVDEATPTYKYIEGVTFKHFAHHGEQIQKMRDEG